MSGFVGIVHLDDAPLDRRLLKRLTAAMNFRGPDRQQTVCGLTFGFGHTLARLGGACDDERQPFTLDDSTWIVADARIDARVELQGELAAIGEPAGRDASDVELVLRAYRAWGEGCVDHLLGDFAFAIWDAARRQLFCARDHLGVKSFFYALAGRTLIFSNTLDCVRMHPGVSERLNDLAIADFLLFELNHDPSTTVFADVHRVPPAHTAKWSKNQSWVKRYWTLPIDEPVFYRHADDYVERFNELAEAAVRDRLTTDRVGIFMSGGIDSPALAAVASRVLRASDRSNGVRAFTTTVQGLDGGEGDYAQLVADRLGIPISLNEGGAAAFDLNWSTRRIRTPAPVREVPLLVSNLRAYEEMCAHSRVAFYGEGPDNALQYEWQPYLRHLAGHRRFGRLAGDILRHVRSHRRLPLISLFPRLVRARRDRRRWDMTYPSWVNPALEQRYRLRERWEQYQYPQPPQIPHPVRPAAYASFCGPEWEGLFRGFDPEETGTPLQVRHPYIDLRLLRYLLKVPPVPWCRSKFLIRAAMREQLPQAVLERRKSGLSGDLDYETVRQIGLPPLVPDARLGEYVDASRVPDVSGSGMIDFRTDFRPRALNYWLENLQGSLPHVEEENEHDVAHA